MEKIDLSDRESVIQLLKQGAIGVTESPPMTLTPTMIHLALAEKKPWMKRGPTESDNEFRIRRRLINEPYKNACRIRQEIKDKNLHAIGGEIFNGQEAFEKFGQMGKAAGKILGIEGKEYGPRGKKHGKDGGKFGEKNTYADRRPGNENILLINQRKKEKAKERYESQKVEPVHPLPADVWTCVGCTDFSCVENTNLLWFLGVSNFKIFEWMISHNLTTTECNTCNGNNHCRLIPTDEQNLSLLCPKDTGGCGYYSKGARRGIWRLGKLTVLDSVLALVTMCTG